jgi:hypothetical protein
MKENDLISIYSGNEASANLIRGRLERAGISSVIKKVSNAGTWGVVPDNIDLFVEQEDEKMAQKIIEEYIQVNKSEKL